MRAQLRVECDHSLLRAEFGARALRLRQHGQTNHRYEEEEDAIPRHDRARITP
jgi:hypothetical protein